MRAKRTSPRIVAVPHQAAEVAIGKLELGARVIGLTKGQFSLLDLLRAVLAQTGPAHVCVSTWTTGIRDAENAMFLLDGGQMLSFRLLTDRSFAARQAKYCARIRQIFGDNAIRATRTHAKFATIRNDTWSVCIRSSMNLNRNPRFEQFDLDDDPEICAFFQAHADEMEDLMPPGPAPQNIQVDAGLTKALGGGLSDIYALSSAVDDDATFDMSKYLED